MKKYQAILELVFEFEADDEEEVERQLQALAVSNTQYNPDTGEFSAQGVKSTCWVETEEVEDER